VEAVPAVWDDDTVDWTAVDLVVVRSTWDYARRYHDFLAWTHMVAQTTTLANRADVIAWNTDKRYLAELADRGLPVVPTTFLAPGDAVVLPDHGDYVVKPTTSAGSRDTARYVAGRHDAAARRHVQDLLAAGREVMVQPYLDAVDTVGETALLYVDGRWSHAIRKGALLRPGAAPTDGLFAEEDVRPRRPTAAQRAVADRVITALPDDLLYARVDLLDGPEGPLVLEVEVTEPSMFLATDPAAPARFARAIAARAREAG
jgi:glutathione synthase/RimK-type ligase-like ATP-grasp enzyme